uniref:Spondin-1 n=1 Tax=Culicoides sonorensis TaxID=179676 RepID=A0A336LL51_CULSO
MNSMSSLLLLLVIFFQINSNIAIRCDRNPEGFTANKSPADGRFRLKISGNPERYTPGETYTITLYGTRPLQVPQKFIGFALGAEKDTDARDQFATSYRAKIQDVGEFHIESAAALAIFSGKCPGLIQHSSSMPKTEVQVSWTAPLVGAGCIAIRATVIEHRDIWYKDDGPLSKVLCEDEVDSLDSQPAIVDPCCACDEAKYELTFEGLWSRHTHPKDFPSNGWLTRFSDVIGASHTVEYRFWEYGQSARDGLQQIAEHGSTRKLEFELKDESEHIRTIIKARGIAYPNVTGKTFAVFRVDSSNHLVSLVSQIDPSPDWFVGVSGLELCLSNCSWVENKVLNLYPVDAGTDSGPSYISPKQPTIPREAIRRIKTNSPNDVRSPFYDPSGNEMKPMARLYLNRQRIYEKVCEGGSQENTEDNACDVGPWGNVQCGQGKRYKQRSYVNEIAASQANCKKKLTMREDCYGKGYGSDCDDLDVQNDPDDDGVDNVNPDCGLTEWGPWSECSTECGMGTRTRSRRYKNKKAQKKCTKGVPNPPALSETVDCRSEVGCSGDITPEPVSSAPRGRPSNSRCKMTPWSEWSPCSATCGYGRKIRSRMPMHKHNDFDKFNRRVMDHYHKRTQSSNEQNDNDDDEENTQVTDPSDPCYGEQTIQEVRCGQENPPCQGLFGATPEFCYLEPKVGNCRGSINRWYYDKNKKDCRLFPYTECGGNKNNFLSREDCLTVCGRQHLDNLIRDQIRSNYNEEIPYENNEKIDCVVTEWRRSACNATCGEGYRTKTRTILTHPKNGGRKCPLKLRKIEKCTTRCESKNDINSFLSNTNRIQNELSNLECEYSPWSNWSPCSKSCGEGAVQQRTRYVLNPTLATFCTQRLEERPCDNMPCLVG